jgi:hypothetical protein
MTKRPNPDVIIRFAVQLSKRRWRDGKAFNAAMRAEFPTITPYALRKAYQDAKILIALQQLANREKDTD